MVVLNPIPDNYPNPDCAFCGGEGKPQSKSHRVLADEWSNGPCSQCWIEHYFTDEEDTTNDQ